MFKSKYLVLAFALFVIWLGAFLLFHIAVFLLRALLLIVAILIIAHFLSKWREAARRG
jgi:hypothetical protein